MAKITSNTIARFLLAAHGALAALTVDVENADSVRAAAALVAEDLMSFYHGNETGQIPGILPEEDYYWWTGGVLWNAMLDYRNRTGETKYDSVISQGLQWQIGPNDDYLPLNTSASTGNDDQAFWALSALSADESGLLAPADLQWLTLAKNVFDEQHGDGRRVEYGDCEGALRWQLFPASSGYNYVNSASNIGYFDVAAQLAYLTGNKTYLDAADDAFDLLENLGFVSDKFDVYDGAHTDECKSINKVQFSNTAANLLQGSAYLYNHTGGDDDWKERVDGLLDRTLELFFPDGVAFETACEKSNTCNTDMRFFKSILHRALASTMKLAPYTSAKILPVLKSSAKAAAAQCTGGDNGRMCGFHWSSGKFDDETGAGPQMSVLSALVSILPEGATAAAGTNTGSGNGSGSGSGSSGATEGTTSGDSPSQNMGASVSTSLGALVGSLLIGGLLLA